MGGQLPARVPCTTVLVRSALSLKQIYENCLEVGMLSFLFIVLAPDHSGGVLNVCLMANKIN